DRESHAHGFLLPLHYPRELSYLRLTRVSRLAEEKPPVNWDWKGSAGSALRMSHRNCLPCCGIVAGLPLVNMQIRRSLDDSILPVPRIFAMLGNVALAILTLGGCGGYRSSPLIHAHAHNDYLHR